MPVDDLHREWSQDCLAFSQADYDALTQGYQVPVIKALNHSPCYGIGVTQAEFDGGLYQPIEGGVDVIVFGTNILPDGSPEDLICFDPLEPDRFYLRLGLARWLNEWPLLVRQKAWTTRPLYLGEPPNSFHSTPTGEPLHIYTNILKIMQGGFNGAMPLTDDAWLDLNNIKSEITFESVTTCRHAEERMAGKHPNLSSQFFIRKGSAHEER